MNRNRATLVNRQDETCLAEGRIYPVGIEKSGINKNEMIIGGTGSGKTVSITVSRTLHTWESSLVIPVSKTKIVGPLGRELKRRGYEVDVLNLASHPETSTIGYDPLDDVETESDVMNLAETLVKGACKPEEMIGANDIFWEQTATDGVAAMIHLERESAELDGRRPTIVNVVRMLRGLGVGDPEEDLCGTTLDPLFEAMDEKRPGCLSGVLWKSVSENPIKTMLCIISTMRGMLTKVFSDAVLALAERERRVNLRSMGRKRKALFVVTSAGNMALARFTGIFYADLFDRLMSYAESLPDQTLPVPVHCILDDAVGARVPKLEAYISLFRAAGVSMTMMLQSMHQLEMMYGRAGKIIVQDNCDTTVYMSVNPNDLETCRMLANRLNRPLPEIMNMPLEQVIVMRRGSEAYQARRYQTLTDPLYTAMMRSEAERDE